MVREQVEKTQAKVGEHMEACKLLHLQRVGEVKGNASKIRHAKARIAALLASSGFPIQLTGALSEVMFGLIGMQVTQSHNVQETVTEEAWTTIDKLKCNVDPINDKHWNCHVVVFEAGPCKDWPLMKAVSDLAGNLQKTLEDKTASAEEKFAAEKTCAGVVSRVSLKEGCNYNMCAELVPPGQQDGAVTANIEGLLNPWWFTYRRNMWKEGPAGYPLTGVSNLVTALSDFLWLLVLPVAQLLKSGISVPDYASFLDSPKGVEFFCSHARLVLLMAGDVAWVPMGCLCHGFHFSPPSKDAAANKKDTLAHGWCVPVFSKGLFLKVPRTTGESIIDYNLSHAKAQNRTIWKERAQALEKWSEVMTETWNAQPAPKIARVKNIHDQGFLKKRRSENLVGVLYGFEQTTLAASQASFFTKPLYR